MANHVKTPMKVKVCEICGDAGFSDCLAICNRCKKGAEHVYCMGSIPTDTVPSDWICETCEKNDKVVIFPYPKKLVAKGSNRNDCNIPSYMQSHSEVKSLENSMTHSTRTIANKDKYQTQVQILEKALPNDMQEAGCKISSENVQNGISDTVVENRPMLLPSKKQTNEIVSCEVHKEAQTIVIGSENTSFTMTDDCEGRSSINSSSPSGNLRLQTGVGSSINSLSTELESLIKKNIEETNVLAIGQIQLVDSTGCGYKEKLTLVSHETGKSAVAKDSRNGLVVHRCLPVTEREVGLGLKIKDWNETNQANSASEIARSSFEQHRSAFAKDDARDHSGEQSTNVNAIRNTDVNNDRKSNFIPSGVVSRSGSMETNDSFNGDKLLAPSLSTSLLTNVERSQQALCHPKLKDPLTNEIRNVNFSSQQSDQFEKLQAGKVPMLSGPRVVRYKCHKCKKFGHLAKVCTEKFVGQNKEENNSICIDHGDDVCYECNTPGHAAKLCIGECVVPNEQETRPSGHEHVCNKCTKSGHLPKNCHKCYNCNKFGHFARLCPDETNEKYKKFAFDKKQSTLKDCSNTNLKESRNEFMKPDCLVKVRCSERHSSDEEPMSYCNVQPKGILQRTRKRLKQKTRTIDARQQKCYENNRYDKKPRFESSGISLECKHPGVSVSYLKSSSSICLSPVDLSQEDVHKANKLKQAHCSNEGLKDDPLNCKILQFNRDMDLTRSDHRCTKDPRYKIQTRNEMAPDCQFPCSIDPFLVRPIPDSQALWGGCLILHWNSSVECYKRFQAHPSNMADPKVFQVMATLPSQLHLEVVKRGLENNTWPRSFNECPPTSAKVGMYFFADDTQSYTKSYKPLLDRLSSRDLVLRIKLEVAQLIVYPSCLLPKQEHYWNGRRYLWGIFRPNKKSIVLEGGSRSQGDENGEVIDMDIDMIGGAEVPHGYSS